LQINISENISKEKPHNLIEAIKSKFLFSKNKAIKRACIKHITDDASIFVKVNISTYSAFMSDSVGLKIAMDNGYAPLTFIDGRSLLDMCQDANDSESIEMILQFFNTRGGKLDLNTLLYCLLNSTPQTKRLMQESLFRPT